MIRLPLTTVLAIASIGMAACDSHGNVGRAGGKFCYNFKAAPINGPLTVSDAAAAPADDCVRRWAYALAPSRDTADVVATAAVAACGARITVWNQTTLSQQTPTDGGAPQGESLSIISGQPTNPVAEHSAFVRGRALLYVVQARAGHCGAPPVVNGAPAGV